MLLYFILNVVCLVIFFLQAFKEFPHVPRSLIFSTITVFKMSGIKAVFRDTLIDLIRERWLAEFFR